MQAHHSRRPNEGQQGTSKRHRGASKRQRGTSKCQRGTSKRQKGAAEQQQGTPKWQMGTSKSTGKVFYTYQGAFSQWVPPPKSTLVAAHYDTIAHKELSSAAPQRFSASRHVKAVRLYNNWLVSCLIQRVYHQLSDGDATIQERGVHVLDMAGGKGGAIGKWGYVGRIASYTLLDISAESVQAAYQRVKSMQSTHFAHPQSTFIGLCMDVSAPPSQWAIPNKAHVAMANFCLNYLANQKDRMEAALRLAYQSTVAGAYFIITFTNAASVTDRLVRGGGSWNNSICSIRAVSQAAYSFTLQPSVNGCEEFALDILMLETAASATGWSVNEFCDNITQIPSAWLKKCSRPPPSQDVEAREVSSLYAYAILERT